MRTSFPHFSKTICVIPNFNYSYKAGEEINQLLSWLWSILESFNSEEKVLFMRFISGRSRLPTNSMDLGQKFQIIKVDKVNRCFLYYSLRNMFGSKLHFELITTSCIFVGYRLITYVANLFLSIAITILFIARCYGREIKICY